MLDRRFDTTLITGATGGIGWELARCFAPDSGRMVLVGRDEDKLRDAADKLENEFGIETRIVVENLAEPGAAKRIAETVESLCVQVDALVNCAGFAYDERFIESDIERQKELVQVNDMALMELCHVFAPAMAERGHGSILNVASMAGFMAGPFMATYYASKAFVQSFSQSLRIELYSSGVHVTALCPGPVRTEFWDKADAGNTVLAHVTLGPRQIAKTAYLALKVNKAFCVPGLLPKVVVFITRLLPRTLITRIAGLLQLPNRKKGQSGEDKRRS